MEFYGNEIYFGNKPLLLLSHEEFAARGFNPATTLVWTAQDGAFLPANIVNFFRKFDRIVYLIDPATSPVLQFNSLTSNFKHVRAAGGIVEAPSKEVVMIYRSGRWDLPKGHIEVGESAEVCAIREIEEETAVVPTKIVSRLGNTHHAYNVYGAWELKQTEWFLLETDSRAETKPQSEEGIERAVWCNPMEVEQNLQQSFPTIRKVFQKYELIKHR